MKAGLATLLVLSALAGCAGAPSAGSNKELKTASDETAIQKRASIRLQLAIGYYEDGKYEVALDEVKLALAADPSFADAYGVRALIYTKMGQIALAEDNYQRAMRLAPGNPDLANNYGSFLCQVGKGEEGMKYFETALKDRSYKSPVRALLNAGSCSIKLKHFLAAERYLLDALRIEPDLPTTNANLARVYYERRDYTRAQFYLNRLTAVAKLDTLDAEVLWLGARIEHKMGDKTKESAMVVLLRRHHPASPEFAAYQRGAFDE
ncbi:MAG: type IV pilus biogenesis/stability protein PilW [Pseudomonadota bacterium]